MTILLLQYWDMNPDQIRLLDEAVSLARENNRLLRAMRRSGRLNFILRLFYWAIIIGLSYGAYIYIQPYVETLQSGYTTVKTEGDRIKGLVDTVKGLVDQVPKN